MIYSVDGNNFYPVVGNLAKNGPAKKAGMKKYDMIVAIDGVSMLNKTITQFWSAAPGQVGTKARVDVVRLDKKLSFELTRVSGDTLKY